MKYTGGNEILIISEDKPMPAKHIKSQSKYHSYNEVFNLCNTSDIKLTTGVIISIGRFSIEQDHDVMKTNLAIIVSTKLAFWLARMYATYQSVSINSNKDVRVLNHEYEAFEWLQQTGKKTN